MRHSPLVSIVIPCYNHAQFVQESIQSVIDQDYENVELIIIDDGSKDNSVGVIQEMVSICEKRFSRFEFRHRANKGLCKTLNEAMAWCKGKYVSFIASDDIMYEYKTREQVAYLEKNIDVIGVFGAVEVMYENGHKEKIIKSKRSYSFEDIFLHNHNLPAPTSMIRGDNIKSLGGFREDFIIEDWMMWLELTESGGKLDYINRVFSLYRRHNGNMSGQYEKMYMGRMQIVEEFKSKKKYTKAKALVNLVHARDVQTANKFNSISYALKAFFIDAKVVFTMHFVKYLVGFFVLKGRA